MAEVKKIGYYNVGQAGRTGTAIWRHEDGREVEVSVVCEPGKTPSDIPLSETTVIGPLMEFVRPGKLGEWDR